MTNTPAEIEAAKLAWEDRIDAAWNGRDRRTMSWSDCLHKAGNDLQCDLTRTQKQLAEARKLLERWLEFHATEDAITLDTICLMNPRPTEKATA